jgi:Ca2+-binding EF-hand superfamily protein
MKQGNILQPFTNSLLESDLNFKGYLPRPTIEAIFRKAGLRDLKDQQFNLIFGALDKNTSGEENYKQLLELLIGADEAQRVFAAA